MKLQEGIRTTKQALEAIPDTQSFGSFLKEMAQQYPSIQNFIDSKFKKCPEVLWRVLNNTTGNIGDLGARTLARGMAATPKKSYLNAMRAAMMLWTVAAPLVLGQVAHDAPAPEQTVATQSIDSNGDSPDTDDDTDTTEEDAEEDEEEEPDPEDILRIVREMNDAIKSTFNITEGEDGTLEGVEGYPLRASKIFYGDVFMKTGNSMHSLWENQEFVDELSHLCA